MDSMKLLLNAGANANACTTAGKTPISLAISSGHLPIVQYLLEYDKTLMNHKDLVGTNLLMLASEASMVCVKKGYGTGIIELLTRTGIDINEEDSKGMTALDRLCTTGGYANAASMLITAGARVITRVDKKHPLTSLMIAALNGHTDLCELLIDSCKIDPNIRSEVLKKLISMVALHWILLSLVAMILPIV